MDEKMIDFLQAAHTKTGILSGCFQRHLHGTINDVQQSKQTMIKRKKTKEKKPRKKGCKANKCRRTGTRKCLPKGRKDYKCKCRRGYAGRYCERGNILFKNYRRHDFLFHSAYLPQEENQKLSGRKWLQVKKITFSETL